MPQSLFKLFIIAATLALMSGCKVAVIVAEGGHVASQASGTCLAGNVCIHTVSDTSYSETFTAVPDAGWTFVRWNSGGDFLCQDSTDSVCAVSNVAMAGNATIESIVASDQAFYIMPVFRQTGLSVTDTITADGREWAQPDLFTNLTWVEIQAVCPLGTCGNSGTLNGYDMTGWRWASIDDVNALFNSYLSTSGVSGANLLGPGMDSFSEPDAPWAAAFFSDGWRATFTNASSLQTIEGLTSELGWEDEVTTGVLQWSQSGAVTDSVGVGMIFTSDSQNVSSDDMGAWFFRVQ